MQNKFMVIITTGNNINGLIAKKKCGESKSSENKLLTENTLHFSFYPRITCVMLPASQFIPTISLCIKTAVMSESNNLNFCIV